MYSIIERDVLNNFFAKKLPLSKLEDGDVLSREHNSLRVLKSLGVKKVIDKDVIKQLKRMKIKTVVVFQTGPKFGPAIFLATVITILFPMWYSLILLL
ncbi:MAG: hypothetical protein GOV15_04535 [Candidatus Diapherotrites archaeon]|nr:hypothetical protein [Candidatus Diapherotrites archaeon]